MRRPPDRFSPLAERLAFGKSRRHLLRRVDQSFWRSHAGRPDPIDLLQAASAGRIEELLPIKLGRMAASPFGFFRGAVPLMACDLAALPTTRIEVQMCGDAHARNLGAFAAPDGHLVFDINDFDETMRGPWEWDIKRLAASAVLVGREAGDAERSCSDAVETLVRTYRESMFRFASMPAVELVRYEIRRYRQATPVHRILRKAERSTPVHLLETLTVRARGNLRRFARRPPLLEAVSKGIARRVLSALAPYRDTVSDDRRLVLDAYRPVDVSFKVVGTGSVGLRDHAVLCLGSGPGDHIFLQVKEERGSAWAPYLKRIAPPSHEGRRVAEGQHRMQTMSDPFLGWTTIGGRHFLVRQLADHKAGVNPADLKGAALTEYAAVCGEIFAKAHARTTDPAILAGYLGDNDRLDRALGKFAIRYADQTTADHQALLRAIRSGRVKARRGL